MVAIRQGDVVWIEADDKRRPALMVTRTRAIPVLHRLLVAPITRSVRGIPTEVALGQENGLKELSAASFDNLQLVAKRDLAKKVGTLSNSGFEICRALEALADC